MSDTVICPNCKFEIEVTEVLSAQLIFHNLYYLEHTTCCVNVRLIFLYLYNVLSRTAF